MVNRNFFLISFSIVIFLLVKVVPISNHHQYIYMVLHTKSNSFILFVVLVEKNSRFFFESKMERESENHYSKLNIHTLDRFFSIDKNLLSWLNLNRIFFRFRFRFVIFFWQFFYIQPPPKKGLQSLFCLIWILFFIYLIFQFEI